MPLNYILTITDREKQEAIAQLYSGLELQPILTNLAHGTARGEHLSLYGLDETEKAIVSSFANEQDTQALMKRAKNELYMDIPGNGVMLAMPLKSVAGGPSLSYLSAGKETGGKPDMDIEHELIVAILNEGQSELVMNAAREAGATGGTVLHAKGTGSKENGKFLGVSIAQEKDMVYIVARSQAKAEIMKNISRKAGPNTKAGAICFSLPITSVVGLRESE